MNLTSLGNLLTPVSNLCMIGVRVFHLNGTPHIIEKLWGILFIFPSSFLLLLLPGEVNVELGIHNIQRY